MRARFHRPCPSVAYSMHRGSSSVFVLPYLHSYVCPFYQTETLKAAFGINRLSRIELLLNRSMIRLTFRFISPSKLLCLAFQTSHWPAPPASQPHVAAFKVQTFSLVRLVSSLIPFTRKDLSPRLINRKAKWYDGMKSGSDCLGSNPGSRSCWHWTSYYILCSGILCCKMREIIISIS